MMKGRVTMVRILEQTSFGWMLMDTDIGKVVFVYENGEEQVIKFSKGEKIPFEDEIMRNAVVFLANDEEFDGLAGRVESLDLVRYILKDKVERREIFTKWNANIFSIAEILRIYRDVLESKVTKIGDDKSWWLVNTPFKEKAVKCKQVTVYDLPPLREALISGLNTNF